MIYLSAGHNPQGPKKDPGAVANGYTEAELTVAARGAIGRYLNSLGAKWTHDADDETLAEYTRRIKTGSGSVVCDLHFNAHDNKNATGCEVIIPARHTRDEYEMAKEIAACITMHTGIPRRGKAKDGVITETESKRGSLAIMREEGLNVLVEFCFMSNITDLNAYKRNMDKVAKDIAAILWRYDKLYA